MTGRITAALLGAILLVALTSAPAVACSPPFEPTIAKLGPSQVVVVGTIGEKVAGGRVFHVERWFNGGAPTTPILIAFKEGEPVGDCSYPVHTGQHLIIAPMVEDGHLAADLATLQADPDTAQGRALVAEAESLFGRGTVPTPTDPPAGLAPAAIDGGVVVAGLLVAVVLLFGLVVLAARRSRRTA